MDAMSDDLELVKEVKDAYEASENGWKKNRESALRCARMVSGIDHWPDEIRRQRELENRPCLTVNKLPKFISSVTGQYRLANMSISVSPADSYADVALAEVYGGLIRAIQYESSAQIAYRMALQASAVGGFGWFRVSREYEENDSWDQVLRIRPIPNPFSVYLDPASYFFDLSDANYVILTDEVAEEDFKRLYPGKETSDLDGTEGSGDKKRSWHNERDKTVRVAEYWKREGTTRKILLVNGPDGLRSVFAPSEEETEDFGMALAESGSQVVRERDIKTTKITTQLVCGSGAITPKLDHIGTYFPFIPVYGEEMVFDGERHLWGITYHQIDPQRIYNFQWTAAVETVALQPKAPYMLTQRQINDGENDHTKHWASVNSGRPYVLYNPDPNAPVPQRQQPPTIPSGMLELCDRASYDLMETSGIYQANLGESGNEKSGRAILARQKQGDVATATWPDNLRLAMEHCGRVLIDLIPKVYDTQRTVRILGEDLKTVAFKEIDFTSPDASRGKYDLVVTVGQSYDSRRQEAQAGIMEIMKVLPPEALVAVVPILLKYTDNPAAREVAEALAMLQQQMMGPQVPEGVNPESPLPPEVQQMVRQLAAQSGMPETEIKNLMIQRLQSEEPQ